MPHLPRRLLLIPGLLISAIFAFATSAAAAPPNVLLIVSDDQGYRDLGCFGSNEIKTPHLDRLASQGIKLTSFYVTWPACTPSRGSLLTGRYPQRNGTFDMYRNEAPDYGYGYKPHEYRYTFERIGGMDTREILLPRLLKPAGYVSAIYGKWDLGVHKRFLPLARGFDDFYGFTNTGVDYYTHERYGVPSMVRNNEPTEEDKGTYCTYLFAREAKRFLNERAKARDEGTDRDAGRVRAANEKDGGAREAASGEPFFLYVPFNAPHSASNLDPKIRGGAQGPEKYKKLYPHLKTEYREVTRYGEPAMAHTRDSRRLEYLAAVTCMDEQIGEFLALLDKHDFADNTIVIFFSDNGGGGGAVNTPLRGGKGRMYEGGLRVPCIVRWPGVTKPGASSDAFVTSMEFVPTLLAAAGIEPPKDLVLDGFDMRGVLTGEAKSQRTEMFWQRRADKAARVNHWKWMSTPGGEALYDLSTDIGEKRDLSAEKPDVLRMMRARFAAWQQRMDAAEPRGPFRDY